MFLAADSNVGIAADEAKRCKDDMHKRYPLVVWGINEAQTLQICYDRGFDWDSLYYSVPAGAAPYNAWEH